jgi:choline-sulfatase
MKNAYFSRRRFLQLSAAALASQPGWQYAMASKPGGTKPNVLMVVMDDLNDWVGCLGGYPGKVFTPHLDTLAASGTLFTNAHCAIPLCNGSRTSTLTGLSPLQTGVTYNNTQWRDLPKLKSVRTLPQYFQEAGYRALGAGKVFHFHDAASWNGFWPENVHGFPPEPVEPDNEHPMKGGPPQNRIDASFDWGAVNTPVEQTPDYQVASYIIEALQQPTDKPLFIGLGLGKPHLPWYLPAQYFDRYPLESIQLPAVLQQDLNDVPAAAKALVNEYIHQDVVRMGFWKHAVQAYLASITFADEQLGRVLTALKQSPLADNTLVVLWSDHGWHLGEKMQWRKLTLWEEATHVPLIIAGPGIHPGQQCNAPVSLLDIVPTLGGLCGLNLRAPLPGRNLQPLLATPDAKWDTVAATVWYMDDALNMAVRDRRYRYIRYADGSEELYDHEQDPHEWRNLAAEPSMTHIRATLAKKLRQQQEVMNRAMPPD